jgi:hypothetical protein
MKKSNIILLTGLFVILLILLGLLFYARFQFNRYLGKSMEYSHEEIFVVDSTTVVDLQVNSGGSISIQNSLSDTTHIRILYSGSDQDVFSFSNAHAKDTVYFIVDENKELSGFGRKPIIKIQLPSHVRLNFDTKSGSVNIADTKANVVGKTGGGSIDMKNCQGGYTLTSGGGSIDMRKVAARVDVSTGGGSIDLIDSELSGEVRTGGGNMDVKWVKGDVALKTGGGSIDMKNCEISEEVRTGGGNVDVSNCNQGAHVSTGGGSIDAAYVSNYIVANTGGGNIDLKEIDGWIDASTGGGNVSAVCKSSGDYTDHNIKLSSGGGDVYLELPQGGQGYTFDVEIKKSKAFLSDDYEIISEFEMEVDKKKPEGGDIDYIIRGWGVYANGQNQVSIHTKDGDVEIQKR